MKMLLGILLTLVSLLSFGQGTITWNANAPSPTDYSNVSTRMGSQEYKPRDNPFQHGYDSYIGNKGFLYYPFYAYPASTTHKINIDDASKYLPKSYLDSVIYHYNKANYNALLHSDISDTITNNKLTLPYIKTLRRVYGDIKSAKVLKTTLTYFDSVDTELRFISVAYETVNSGSFGQMAFTYGLKDSSYLLTSIKFYPYDSIQSVGITGITQKSLEAIHAKNFSDLNKQITVGFNLRIENRDAFERNLSKLNLDSIRQFTSGVTTDEDHVYLIAVFDMPYEKNMLNLTYKLEGTQYKLDDIAYIPKKK